jgi:hypothetical protein
VNEFKLDGHYVFDAGLYVDFAKDTLTVGDIMLRTANIGDGASVRVDSKDHGMCGSVPVFPWYCREV